MTADGIEVKICGINSPEAARATAGADFIGFVFYEPSPRYVTPERAAELAAELPPGIKKVGLFVDPTDAEIAAALDAVALDMLQLHGSETPERIAAIKARFKLPVMKAVKLAAREDLGAARDMETLADRILFDAKPPAGVTGALPGGNARAFDWMLLKGYSALVPWMLSGGLTPENVADAVATSGARGVDVSSGVEDKRGHKDPELIRRFIAAAKRKNNK